jgi:hypothetical protein
MEKYYDIETKTLKLPGGYNDELVNIPEGTQTIIFDETESIIGPRFNKPINALPDSVITIILGNEFNQSVANLPKSLKSIYDV